MIYFTYSTTQYNFRNPDYQNVLEVTQKTLYGRTASGVLYRYSKGVAIKKYVLRWSEITEEEKTQLITVFSTIGTNSFTFRDHQNVSYTAYFLFETLKFEQISDDEENQESFYLSGKKINSTIRKNGRYTVEIELEVS